MVLPEATLDNAVQAAERFRQLVANRLISAADQRVPITISLDVASADEQTSGIEELIKQSDLALYEAKHAGRNRVCRFSRDTPNQAD
jgi:diguanylate cyclase (GGDEF)-like protein